MMRNVNSLLREFHSNFNRFLIVESQFTFHYRDKWLEMNSQNLLSIKNTKSIFYRFCFVAEILWSFLISWEKSFWDANNKKRLPSSEGIADSLLPFGRDSRRKIKSKNDSDQRLKEFQMWISFVYTTVWSDSLNNPKQSGSDEFIYWIPLPPHHEARRAFHLFIVDGKSEKSEEKAMIIV